MTPDNALQVSDGTALALVGLLFTPILCPAVCWWTRFCIRRYRRWAR